MHLMHTYSSIQTKVDINGRYIGPDIAPYIVAEMSGNHNGDINRAIKILDCAKAAGADAVKLQTYTPDTITINHDSPEFVIDGGLWNGRRLHELYEEAHTPWEWHRPLFEHASNLGITIFSSPFDHTAVDFLEQLHVPAYKIASPELIDLPLIRHVAATGKPMVMSTGMASIDEIGEALEAARTCGAKKIIVLHCTSAYPTPPQDANLSSMKSIAKEFNVVVGLSDHTHGTLVSTLAVAMGACFIEKHVTLSRADGGVDSEFSLEPHELTELVQATQTAYAAIGKPTFQPTDSELTVLKNRRSLYVVEPVAKGELFNSQNVRSIRPGNGLKPKYLEQIIGKSATRDIHYGEPLQLNMIDVMPKE